MYVFPEAASRAIVQFLEVNQSEETSRGWMLLTTINLLASSGQVGGRKEGGELENMLAVLALGEPPLWLWLYNSGGSLS